MGFFDDDTKTLHHCQACQGEFPEDEMANDEECKNCAHKQGQQASFFEGEEAEPVVEAFDEMEASDDDPDFEGMYMEDDDSEFGLFPEGDESADMACEDENKDVDALEEGTQFDKFMDKILIHEARKEKKDVLKDSPSVRYNKRYGELAQNRITYKK